MSFGEYVSVALVLLNVLLGLIAFFGGMVIRGLSESIKELQKADMAMAEKLGEYVKRDDLKEWKDEQRELFNKLFDKLEKLQDELHGKVDRTEFNDTGSFRGRSK